MILSFDVIEFENLLIPIDMFSIENCTKTIYFMFNPIGFVDFVNMCLIWT